MPYQDILKEILPLIFKKISVEKYGKIYINGERAEGIFLKIGEIIESALSKVRQQTIEEVKADYSVSEWERIGRERGYWAFFETNVRKILDERDKGKLIIDNWDDFLMAYFHQDCPGCINGHNSWWKTLIESEQWMNWTKYNKGTNWDFAECEELGIISQDHFQAFVNFLKEF